MVGNASFKVASACSIGLSWRGCTEGGSSALGAEGFVSEAPDVLDSLGDAGTSSSSKSSSRAVVGDSGGPAFYTLLAKTLSVGQAEVCTGFSESAMLMSL